MKNEIFAKRIKEIRKKNNMTQEELAGKLDLTNSTISYWEKGDVVPGDAMLKKISQFFGVTIDWLLGNMGNIKGLEPIIGWREIPVYSQISCGNGCFNDNDIEEYIAVPANLVRSANSFGVYANGDSMVNAGIVEGEILIFSKSDEVNSGDIVCACYEGQMYCKRFKLINNAIVLVSENPNYDPIIIDENKNFSVLGKLIYSVKKY